MAESDHWDRDPETGDLLVAMLSGFATACAPDGSLAVLRLAMDGNADGRPSAVQIVLRPDHVHELIETLSELDAKLALRAKKGGRA